MKVTYISDEMFFVLFLFSFFQFTVEPSLLGDPFRRENRHLGSTEPSLLTRLPLQQPPPLLQPQGGWLEEDTNREHLNNRSAGNLSESDPSDKQRGRQNSFTHGTPASILPGLLSHVPQVKKEEVA